MLTRGWSCIHPIPPCPMPKMQSIQAACALGHRPPGGPEDSLPLRPVHLAPFLQLTSIFKNRKWEQWFWQSCTFLLVMSPWAFFFPFFGRVFLWPPGENGPNAVLSQGTPPRESKGKPIPGKPPSAPGSSWGGTWALPLGSLGITCSSKGQIWWTFPFTFIRTGLYSSFLSQNLVTSS